MSDPGHEETDAILKELEKRITKEYRRAEREIQAKLDDYLKRFETKDKIWQKWVEQGAKTEKQYQEWKIGQLAVGKKWSDQRQLIVRDLSQANKIARNIVSEKMPTVYAVNHNYGTYEVEHGTGVDTYYALYDHDTVEGLFKERKVYHDPGRKVLSDIAKGKETRWNTKNVQSAMIQSILQGESIPKIATRIADTVGEQNRKAAIRNARTITTGVENRGRVDSYERARDKGINVRQQWLATLDGRTRHSHRVMDGEIVDPGEEFSNGCRFPGDPEGKPAEIYNCRCTLIAALKGFEHKATDLSTRNTNKLEGMTYEEWKREHGKSQSITHQEDVGKNAEKIYVDEYKYGFLKESIPNVSVTKSEAAEDWFEYEKANAMSEYIKTGNVPKEDLYNNPFTNEERARLKAEAEFIQKEGENNKTKYKTLYRGMVVDEDVIRAEYTPGERIKLDTLTATATDKKMASIYANTENYYGDGKGLPVIMEIQKPDGIYGFDCGTGEVVLPATSEFKVSRNYMDEDGVVHIGLYQKKGKNVDGLKDNFYRKKE